MIVHKVKTDSSLSISDLIVNEFFDIGKVLDFGATKYEPNNWLKPNGTKSSFKDRHDSLFHHLAQSFAAGPNKYKANRYDDESKLDHLLHLACGALMLYTRIQREITHEKDEQRN